MNDKLTNWLILSIDQLKCPIKTPKKSNSIISIYHLFLAIRMSIYRFLLNSRFITYNTVGPY